MESKIFINWGRNYSYTSGAIQPPSVLHVPLQMPYVGREQIGEVSKGLSLAGQGIQEDVSFGQLEIYL